MKTAALPAPSQVAGSVNARNGNYVSALQEFLIAGGNPIPTYMFDRIGLDHAPDFSCVACTQVGKRKFVGEGNGKSKKEAKQDAANKLWQKIQAA